MRKIMVVGGAEHAGHAAAIILAKKMDDCEIIQINEDFLQKQRIETFMEPIHIHNTYLDDHRETFDKTKTNVKWYHKFQEKRRRR